MLRFSRPTELFSVARRWKRGRTLERGPCPGSRASGRGAGPGVTGRGPGRDSGGGGEPGDVRPSLQTAVSESVRRAETQGSGGVCAGEAGGGRSFGPGTGGLHGSRPFSARSLPDLGRASERGPPSPWRRGPRAERGG